MAVLELKVVAESEMDPATDAAIKQTLVTCFPHRHEEFSQVRTIGNVPVLTTVIMDDEQALAHVAVIERTIKVGHLSIRVAGVASVCVLDGHRGKGLGDRVIKAAIKEAKNAGFDLGILFCAENVKAVYERNGWVDITKRRCTRHFDGTSEDMTPERIRMYHPLNMLRFPPGDIDLCGDKW
ncbi:MAG: GNAT family N-acetyltransferase [Anaerohalosphaera sp.]|nr:GNAT family N-acetyltransferase [Anaerohalosphaera sp.]